MKDRKVITHGEGMNEGKLASLKDQQEMWGGRASRALEALNGKSTGKTSYEQETLKRKRKQEEQAKQRRIEAETLSNKKGLRRGESRASQSYLVECNRNWKTN
jgi:hypothetical protein